MAMVTYPEPTWTVSQDATPATSRLRTLTPTPVVMLGVMVRLLQMHFVDANNIESTLLKNLLWHPDAKQTRIMIDGSTNYRADVVESSPTIYVKRSALSISRVGVGEDDVAVQGSSSTPLHQKRVDGIFRIQISSRVPMEAELLGEEVFMRMLRFAPVIRKDIGLGLLQVESLSELQSMQKGAKGHYYTVQVNIRWSHMVRWSLIADAPVLKRLSLTANLV